jgi:cbb3-type cytochrome oxidase subunit 1
MTARSPLSTPFGWLSVAAFIAAAAPAAALAIPAVQRKLSGPMAGVGIGYVLFAWLFVCLVIGAILAALGLLAALKWKEPRTVSAIALALNLVPLVYFFGSMFVRRAIG